MDHYHSFGKKIYTQHSERCNKDKLSLIFISWPFHCLFFYVLCHFLAFLLSLALIRSSVTFLFLTSFLCLSSINDCDIDWIALYTTEQNLPKGLLKMLAINIRMPSSVHNMPCKHPHARAIFFLSFFFLLHFSCRLAKCHLKLTFLGEQKLGTLHDAYCYLHLKQRRNSATSQGQARLVLSPEDWSLLLVCLSWFLLRRQPKGNL